MERNREISDRQKTVVVWLQVLAILSALSYWFTPVLGFNTPGWLSAGLAMACLLGMLSIFWRSGALRWPFLAALVGVLLVASAVASIASHT